MKDRIKEFNLNYEEDIFEIFQINSEEVKEKIVSEEIIDLTGKKIGFILEPGNYQAGDSYYFLETKDKIIHDEEDDSEFLLSINPEENKFNSYNGYIDQYKLLKLIYEEHSVKLEVINDFIATEFGYIATKNILFDSIEDN